MRSLDIHDPSIVRPVHAMDQAAGPDGIIYYRYPLADIESFGDMAPIARFQTGIELQVLGSIKQLRLTVRVVTSDHYGICAEFYRGPHKLLPTWQIDSHDSEPQVVTVDTVMSLAPDLSDSPVRFVFPTHTVLEILRVEVDDEADVRPSDAPWTYNALTDQRPLTYVAYGDSITHGANVTVPTGTWFDMLAKTFAVDPVNIANGGHGKAEIAMARHIAARDDMDLLSLHMGVNSSGLHDQAEFDARFDAFIGAIRERHPRLPIVAVSPIWSVRDRRPPGSSPQDIRNATAAVCARRRAAGDSQLHYVDGLSLRFAHHLLNGDWLHLNEHASAHYYHGMLPIIGPIIDELRA